jgi:uncharacterized protein YggT (Ycf19 family)
VSFQIANVIQAVGRFYGFLILAYVLMSWFPMRGILYDINRVLASLVEPYLSIFRRFIPPMGGLDLSPIVAYIVLQFIVYALTMLVR